MKPVAQIFVSIASYRDPDLAATIEDCIIKAAHPGLLRFGVCWQSNNNEREPGVFRDGRVTVLRVPWQHSGGACWARAKIMDLFSREDYFLQVDSHSRFAEGWDEILLSSMQHTGASRPILTAYGPPYTPGGSADLAAKPMKTVLHAFDGALPLLHPEPLSDRELQAKTPIPARFVAAGFLFAPGSFVNDVPYDPLLYFWGEEISLTVRAYTNGYDLFHPSESIVWHYYTREDQPKHWNDHDLDTTDGPSWRARDRLSRHRVHRQLLDHETGSKFLGERRSIAQYETYAGLNFRNQWIDPRALEGLTPADPLQSDPAPMTPRSQDSMGDFSVNPHRVFIDGAACLSDTEGSCETHGSHGHASWMCDQVRPACSHEGETRRFCNWRHGLQWATEGKFTRVIFMKDGFRVPVDLTKFAPRAAWKDWELCTIPSDGSRNGSLSVNSAEPRLLTDVAVAISRSAIERMLVEMPEAHSAMSAFANRWGSLENFVLGGFPNSTSLSAPRLIARLGTVDSSPYGEIRPSLRAGIEVDWLEDGALVNFQNARPQLRLNGTAAAVYSLCNGHRTLNQITQMIADLVRSPTLAASSPTLAAFDLLVRFDLLNMHGSESDRR